MRAFTLFGALLAAQLIAGCAQLPARPTTGKALGTSVHAAAAARGLAGTLQVDGGPVQPGQPSTWRIAFHGADTGAPITAYERDHEKYMHLIAVSADLATFAHVHPDLAPTSGIFTLRANTPTSDPDNQDAARIMPKPGPYLLFTEVVPLGQRVAQATFDLRAAGEASPVALTPDPVGDDGVIRKYFKADGRPGAHGDPYRVALTATKGEHHPGMPMITFLFRLEEARQAPGGVTYVGIDHLQPWLGMPGHAVLIGAKGATAAERTFRHLHAGHGDHRDRRDPGAGPELSFMVMGYDVPDPGLYKIWGQFKYRGRILTFPFALAL